MSRVNSARIAAIKAEHAGLSPVGAVMASDAFFPFRDGIDNAAAVGIKAIIQPVAQCAMTKPSLQPMSMGLRWCSPICVILDINFWIIKKGETD